MLELVSRPIADRGVPEDVEHARMALRRLRASLEEDKTAAEHSIVQGRSDVMFELSRV